MACGVPTRQRAGLHLLAGIGKCHAVNHSARVPLLTSAVLSLVMDLAFAAPIVRVGYVVPQNRAQQAAAVDNLRALILSIQDWYGDQMSRYGFGYKTFDVEMESDGVTPKIHVVSTPMTDATIRTDIWPRTIEAATNAGLPIWSSGQVWLLVPEAHLQNSNGSISGGTALGASFGSGTDGGVAMLGSDMIFRANPVAVTSFAPYNGMTIPEIGPYPLVQGVSFPSFEGTTIGSIASSIQGAAAHELGHAFGLGHDTRNDENFDGVLMGNGLRGWRGTRFPIQFPGEDVQLSYAAALALNESRYFNPEEPVSNSVSPTLSVTTSGTVNPVNGLLQVSFTANDPSGLAAALLRRNGDTIAELALTGTSASTSFLSPYYTPGQNDTFEVSVYDTFGNRSNATVSINVATGFNRAPQPFIDLSRAIVPYGQSVQLSAAASTDPGGNIATTTVEWDFNNDGVFDTMPTTTKTLTRTFTSGDHLITARLTDALGASAIATPIVLRVAPYFGDYNFDNIVDAIDYVVWRDSVGQSVSPFTGADGNGNGAVDPGDYELWRAHFGQIAGSGSNAGTPIPEPASSVLLVLLTVIGMSRASLPVSKLVRA
jgi:Putative peptidase family